MPFGQPGMIGAAAGALGMQKNKQQMQQKQKQAGQGIGPSMGAMGGMMGNKMGQQAQKPGQRNQYGLPFARQERNPQQQQGSEIQQGMGSVLGGSGRMGRRFNMPMQPRQDMYDYSPNIGMSNTQLPQGQQVPMGTQQADGSMYGGTSAPMQDIPQTYNAGGMEQPNLRMDQDPRQQMEMKNQNMLRKQQGGIGPRFM